MGLHALLLCHVSLHIKCSKTQVLPHALSSQPKASLSFKHSCPEVQEEQHIDSCCVY